MNTLEILQNRLLAQKQRVKVKKTLTVKRAEEIANNRLGGSWAVARDTRRLGQTCTLIKDIYGKYYETYSLLKLVRRSVRGNADAYFPLKQFQLGKCPEIYRCELTQEYIHSAYISPKDVFDNRNICITVAYDYCFYKNYIFVWPDGTTRTYAPPQARQVQRYHGSYRPIWWNKKKGMGMELEIDINDKSRFAQNLSDDILIENDGSLGVKGVELIGGPYTLDEYQDSKTPWNEVLEQIKEIGGAGHIAGEFYGIHISVSRSLFTSFHGAKFVCFFNQQAELCQLIGQRKQLYGCGDKSGYHNRTKIKEVVYYNPQDASKHIHYRDNEGRIIQSDPVLCYGGTYINSETKQERHVQGIYTNIETGKYEPVKVDENRYEVRIFRSNLRWERILKNIQFVDAVRVYTLHASASSVCAPYQGTADFLFWLGKQQGYTALKKFLVDNAKNFPDNNANFRVSDKCKDFAQLVSFKLNKSQQVTISDL